MSKQREIRIELDGYLQHSLNGELNKVIDFIKSLEAKYPHYKRLELDEKSGAYYDDPDSIALYGVRDETAAEQLKREFEEGEKIKDSLEARRASYLRMKKEFGD